MPPTLAWRSRILIKLDLTTLNWPCSLCNPARQSRQVAKAGVKGRERSWRLRVLSSRPTEELSGSVPICVWLRVGRGAFLWEHLGRQVGPLCGGRTSPEQLGSRGTLSGRSRPRLLEHCPSPLPKSHPHPHSPECGSHATNKPGSLWPPRFPEQPGSPGPCQASHHELRCPA